jgi:hypothetical protein
MKLRLTLAATLLLGALPLKAHAQAQPWLSDRSYGEGIGVRVGNLELHPGVSGEVGYDSNYFERASPEETPVLAAYRLRVTPSLTLSTLGAQRQQGLTPAGPPVLQFRAGAYGSFNELIASDSKYSSQVSDQRHIDAGADLGLTLFPAGRVGVDSYLNFIRVVQPSNDINNVDNAFNRDAIRVGAGMTWRPGGGLFDWRLGYEFGYNFFELAPYKPFNNYQNTVNMRGRWRFLPRTALLYDGGYSWLTYPSNAVQNDGNIVRSSIGLNGLVTDRLALLGMVGWAGTFYDTKAGETPQQFDSITAQAEVKWYIAGQSAMNNESAPVGLSWVALGYTRDVQNSYLGNFYRRDRGYANLSYLLGGAFVLSLSAGIANIAFPDSYYGASAGVNAGKLQKSAFSEQRFDGQVFGEYRLSDTFGINATVNYTDNITDVYIPVTPGSPIGADYLKFQQWQAFLGVRWFL